MARVRSAALPVLRAAAALAVLYWTLAVASIIIARQPGTIAAVWLANAVAVVFLVTSPRGHAIPLLIAAGVANALANLLFGDSWVVSLAFVVPNLVEIVVAAVLLHSSDHTDWFTAHHGSFLRMLAWGAFVPQLLGATLGAVLLRWQGFVSFERIWLDWYIGSAAGAAAILPLAMSLRSMPRAGSETRVAYWRLFLGVVVVTALAAVCLRYFLYPFVVIGTVLLVVATLAARMVSFALSLAFVCAVASGLAFRWFAPASGASLGQEQAYLATLMVICAVQVVAVLAGRQRALGQILAAVGSRSDSFTIFADLSGALRWVSRSRMTRFAAAAEDGVPELPPGGRHAIERVVAPLLASAQAGRGARMQAELPCDGRGQRTFELVAEPALDEEGRRIGAILCGTDVTERVQARLQLERLLEELRATNGNLEQFVHIASHDLREPLNTISQFSGFIAKRKAQLLDEEGRGYFELVRVAALRMRTLLDDVLRYVQMGGRELAPLGPVELAVVVEEVRSALGAQLERRQATLEVGALERVIGHPTWLSLVLQNLVSNAVKFVPEDRRPCVRVACSVVGATVRLTVEDNGIGIEPERLHELGTPFRRLHSHRAFEGSGLGLAICKRVLERLGGRLEIESTPQVGSRFHVELQGCGDSSQLGAGQRAPDAGEAPAEAEPAPTRARRPA